MVFDYYLGLNIIYDILSKDWITIVHSQDAGWELNLLYDANLGDRYYTIHGIDMLIYILYIINYTYNKS